MRRKRAKRENNPGGGGKHVVERRGTNQFELRGQSRKGGGRSDLGGRRGDPIRGGEKTWEGREGAYDETRGKLRT